MSIKKAMDYDNDINIQIKNREMYIDVLRILACFLVIVCHTYVWGFNKTEYNVTWLLSVAIYLISKTAVPIFFMISGFLNLKKDYSYKEILVKTFKRLILPLIIFSAIIYFKDNPILTIQNFQNFIKLFLQEDIILHYWYLYALIGMYLVTPMLRKMIINFEEEDYKYFIVLWIFSLCVIPILKNILKINISNRIPVITGYIGYYVLGYYIFNYKKFSRNKKNLIINLLSLTLTISLSVMITYIDCKNNIDSKYVVFLDKLNYLSILLPTVNIVYIIKYIFGEISYSHKIEKILVAVSSTTFGIYLTHGILLGKFKQIYNMLSIYIPSFIATILTQMIIFLVLSAVIYIIKKLPVIKKIL